MNKKLFSRTSFIIAFTALVLGSGCAHQIGTVESADRQDPAQPIPENVQFADKSMARGLVVEGASAGSASGNLLRAQVMVVSTRRKPQNLSYRFEWYDGEGMIIDSPNSIWKPLRLLGEERVPLSNIAPNPRAVDFVLKLKRS